MESLLDSCGFPTLVLDGQTERIDGVVKSAVARSVALNQPVVLLVRKDAFETYRLSGSSSDLSNVSRQEAIESIVQASESTDIFVATTGMASRELFEIRVKNDQGHLNDFLTVGSMGHASMIALGVAESCRQHVICLDGDGASIMHLGNLTSIGQSGAQNLIHVLINNAAHDSVGGQPTCAGEIDFPSIARACGYTSAASFLGYRWN